MFEIISRLCQVNFDKVLFNTIPHFFFLFQSISHHPILLLFVFLLIFFILFEFILSHFPLFFFIIVYSKGSYAGVGGVLASPHRTNNELFIIFVFFANVCQASKQKSNLKENTRQIDITLSFIIHNENHKKRKTNSCISGLMHDRIFDFLFV